jgi:hypothetical protein
VVQETEQIDTRLRRELVEIDSDEGVDGRVHVDRAPPPNPSTDAAAGEQPSSTPTRGGPICPTWRAGQSSGGPLVARHAAPGVDAPTPPRQQRRLAHGRGTRAGSRLGRARTVA